MKAVYNIYNVPGVHYCNKYEIIVYTVRILYCQYNSLVYNLIQVVPHATEESLLYIRSHNFTIRSIADSYSSTYFLIIESQRCPKQYISQSLQTLTVGRECFEFTQLLTVGGTTGSSRSFKAIPHLNIK
jgi:hypothetical protein